MEDNNTVETLRDSLDSIIPSKDDVIYPKEAVPLGTLARSLTEKRLGIVTDAYYGDLDKDNKKIIIYTIMLFPDNRNTMYKTHSSDSILVINEYEYDMIAYLMVPPIDLVKLGKHLREPLL
jgi:hypothetical protein